MRVPIKASVTDLYRAWSTQEGLEKWFLRLAAFKKEDGSVYHPTESVTAGASYYWLWHGYGDDSNESRHVTDANGKDFFQFQFSGNCLVSVSIKPLPYDESMVELTQQNIPEDDRAESNLFVQCQLGWTFYLTNLKSVMEHGVDLRNKDEKIGKVVTA